MQALSVVIITKNEEQKLSRCLLSVKEVADEILVVDSYSTDATKEVAQKFNARFIQHPFEGHIQQKNYALQQATHPWVLSLDADEALDDTLRTEVRKVKENPHFQAYQIDRLNNYCGKWIRHGTWYPDRRIRLVNKNFATWGGRNPHDKLIPSPEASIGNLKGNILHYTISNLEEHIKQINYFSSLAAQSKFEAGVKYHWWQLAFNPPLRFLKEYIFKAGFMDGYAGFQIAKLSAYAGFLRYAKLRELWKESNQTRSDH